MEVVKNILSADAIKDVSWSFAARSDFVAHPVDSFETTLHFNLRWMVMG